VWASPIRERRSCILIIDDNVTSIHTLSAALSDLGEVLFATDGETGLRLAREQLPTLIVLDVDMPEMDGFEVCKRLRADPLVSAIPVIFVTAHDDMTHEIRALESGAVDFITKPFNVHVARARVSTQLMLKSKTDLLSQTQGDLKAVLDNVPALIGYWDRALRNRFGNDAYLKWFGRRPDQLVGMHLRDLLGPGVFETTIPYVEKVLCGEAQRFDREMILPDRSSRYVHTEYVPDIKDGETRGFYVMLTDITAQKRAEIAQFEEMETLRVTLNSIGDAVIVTDRRGCITFMNPIAESMTGWVLRDAQGSPIEEIMNLRDVSSGAHVVNPIRFALGENRIVSMALNSQLVRPDGSEYGIEDSAAPIRDADGGASGAIIVFRDVSETRAMAIKMAHMAQYDPLTDLPNRVLLRDRVEQAIQAALRGRTKFALMVLDLDHFKYINESLGHAVGDELLRAVADRLIRRLRATDTVSRRGGDEFILVLPQIDSNESVGQIADKLLESVSDPYVIEGNKLTATFSMGISIYPDDGLDGEALLAHADAAMYQAKQAGRNGYQFYSSEIGDFILARHALENHMREALQLGKFTVHYQPQVDTVSQRVIGVEALVRWRRDDGQLVPPAHFIPLAEETGLIVSLGKFVMLEACRQNRRWQEMGLPAMRMAVNISAMQFAQPNFTEMVQSVLAEAGLHPCHLELEITEGTMLVDTERTRELLLELQQVGISIAIDDFGTGYSSLAYLKRFPVHTLKIDQSFVREVLSDKSDAAIVAAISALAGSLGMELVAEGVEEPGHVEFLQRLKCNVMQGYLFSRPMDAEHLTALLQQWVAEPALMGAIAAVR